MGSLYCVHYKNIHKLEVQKSEVRLKKIFLNAVYGDDFIQSSVITRPKAPRCQGPLLMIEDRKHLSNSNLENFVIICGSF